MKVYAVRHKPTGLFIPRLETGRRRGGSHTEPTDIREPRFFHNYLAARAFLSNWLQGKFVNTTHTSLDGDESYVKVIPQPNRKKAEMEIVEFNCIEVAKIEARVA